MKTLSVLLVVFGDIGPKVDNQREAGNNKQV
jgi:hypothetical protein